MSSPTIWSAGRYDAVGDRIAPIAAEVVAAVDRRRPLSGAAVADLACGTGSAALAAAAAGARVTAVDITPELLAIGAQKADDSRTLHHLGDRRRLRHRSARRIVRRRRVEHGHHLRRAGGAGRRDRPPARTGRHPRVLVMGARPGQPVLQPDRRRPRAAARVGILARPVGCRGHDHRPAGGRLRRRRDRIGHPHMAIGHRRRGHALRGRRNRRCTSPCSATSTAPSATGCLRRSRRPCARTPAPTASCRTTRPMSVVTASRR